MILTDVHFIVAKIEEKIFGVQRVYAIRVVLYRNNLVKMIEI